MRPVCASSAHSCWILSSISTRGPPVILKEEHSCIAVLSDISRLEICGIKNFSDLVNMAFYYALKGPRML